MKNQTGEYKFEVEDSENKAVWEVVCHAEQKPNQAMFDNFFELFEEKISQAVEPSKPEEKNPDQMTQKEFESYREKQQKARRF